MEIIGVTGRKGSGKDTFAEPLIRCGFVQVRFAGPLKDMTRTLLERAGFPPEDIQRLVDGDLKEEPLDVLNGLSTRYAMQTLGTEWGRGFFGQDFWVNLTRTYIQSLDGSVGGVVVTDVRFQNEVDAIKHLGGVVVRLRRDTPRNSFSDHPSETGVDHLTGIDRHILNDGTVGALHLIALDTAGLAI